MPNDDNYAINNSATNANATSMPKVLPQMIFFTGNVSFSCEYVSSVLLPEREAPQ